MVKDLTKGSPTKLIASFAATIIMASMMSYVYNFTDSLMVGWYVSPEALGAVSSVSSLSMVLNNLSVSIVGAFSILAGRFFGAGEHTQLKKMMANATWLTIIIVTVITGISLVILRPMVILMNTPDELVEMSVTYMSIILLAKPFGAPSWLLSGMFRALGDTKTSLYVSIINGFGNVVFNFLFLVVFPMGIAGAALGTLCSAFTGSLIYLFVFKRRMHQLHFGRAEAKPSWSMMKRLLAIGVPIGLESTITSIGSMILQIAINGHGTAAVTGIAMGGKVLNLFWIFFSAFESALLNFCAQNIGAGQYLRVKRGIRTTLFVFLGVGAAFALLAFTSLDNFVYMAFVGNDAEILKVAHEYYLMQIIFFPFIAMLFTWRAGLKAFGSTVPTLFCGISEMIARLVVSFFFANNLFMLFFAGPMAWVASSILVAILYPIVQRREFRGKIPIKEKQKNMPSKEVCA